MEVPSAGRLTGRWLVLARSGDGAAAALGEALTGAGASVQSADLTGLDREAAAAALRDWAAGGDAGGVVYLAAEGAEGESGGEQSSDDEMAAGLGGGLAAALVLAQAADAAHVTAPLWCLTRGAVAVDRFEGADPDAATIWGFGGVLALDRPETWGGLIDLPARWDGGGDGAQRVAALLTAGEREDQVAVRPQGVFGRRLVRAPLASAVPARVESRARTEDAGSRGFDALSSQGTILITGGTGAVGARLARRLAARGARRLLLLGRLGPAAPGADQLARDLTASGAQVAIEACDVGDAAALARLLASVPEDAPVSAVFHAAGVLGEEPPLDRLTGADLAAALRPKALGALHLDRLLRDRPLAAFVLFSSGASAWGTAGRPAYAAANAALDALARRRRAAGRPALAVAWGPWAGGGMVDRAAGAHLRRLGVAELDPDLALDALDLALAGGETDLVVADIDWERFAPVYALTRSRPLLRDLAEARQVLDPGPGAAARRPRAGSELAARLAEAVPGERDRLLVETVRAHAAAVLGHDGPGAIEPARAFKDLGFDSVGAVDLRNRLAAALGLDLPATVVFDHASAEALAGFLAGRLGGGDPEQRLSAELDRIEALAARLTPARLEHSGALDRLRALCARHTPAGPSAEASGADQLAGLLAEASAEDVFALLDRELGPDNRTADSDG